MDGTGPPDTIAIEAFTIVKDVEKDSRAKTRELWLEGSVSPQGRKALASGG